MNLKDRFLYFYLPKYHRLFLRGKPVVLVNSIQKAGTHMLVNALAEALPLKYNERGVYNHALMHTWPEHKAHKNTTPKTVIGFLEHNAWPGELLRGHIEFDASISEYLASNQIPQVVIIRRPLDVLLSLANWWERHNEIPVIAFETFKTIESKEERLMYLVTGQHNGVQVWPNFVARYRAFAGWLADANTCTVRYEDLIAKPEMVAQTLAEFLPVKLNTERFISKLASRDNRTFTKADQKVYTSIPDNVLEKYLSLGGSALETTFGY